MNQLFGACRTDAHQISHILLSAIAYSFLFDHFGSDICLPTSHYTSIFTIKSLYRWVEDGEINRDIFSITRKVWTGKERQTHIYRYFNNVPLRDTEDSIRVNWCELEIKNKSGKITGWFAYVTDHEITADNVMDIIQAGRARWNIENEHNKTLMTNGYNLEQNFGHRKNHLTNLLLTLNLLSFLFHEIFSLIDIRVLE